MADYTLAAPGTVNNPWVTAPGLLVIGDQIKTDATGIRARNAGVSVTIAHNANYGLIITTTVTLATTGSGSDDIILGGAVRTGANAGGVVGGFVQLGNCFLGYVDVAGATTNISGSVAITRAATDVWTCTTTNVSGTIGIVLKQNGTTITGFGSNQTTQYGAEASLAAGAQFEPYNSNTLYISQMTGTGVLVAVSPAFPSMVIINP